MPEPAALTSRSAAVLDIAVASGRLSYLRDGIWVSSQGLKYGPGSAQGHRVLHVLEHTVADPSKPNHTVFNVEGANVIQLLDQAWILKLQNNIQAVTQGNRSVYEIPMGRTIGTASETVVRLVIENGQVVTAYPIP